MKTKPIQTLVSLCFIAIVTLSGSGIGLATQQTSSEVLVRINLHQQSEVQQLALANIPIQARVYDPVGNLSALAFIPLEQSAGLEQQHIQVRILDENPEGKEYFLVRLDTPNARPGLQAVSNVLDTFGNQAIVSVNPAQVKTFFNLGYDLHHISRQPIPYPRESTFFGPPPPLEPDPTIAQMLAQVNSADVYNIDGSLSGEWAVTIGGNPYTIATRHSSNATATQMVTQYAYEQFEALGLSVTYHNYSHPYYGSRRNVVAEQSGIGQPSRIYLITAHIDDMPAGSVAPGADDNASGSTGVLLAAEILSQYDFDCTLRYVLFTGEEQGLFGSYYYAQDASNAGDDIRAVLNLDMIAYNSDAQPILDLHTRPGNGSDLFIANTFAGVIDAYNLNLTAAIHQDGMGYSDHDSFWTFNFPAILAIEDDDDFTPYYHTVNDTLSTLDLAYFTDFVKASLATFAHLGCLISPENGTVSGMVTELDGSTPISGATLEALQGSTVISATISGPDGSYAINLPEGTYTMTASHPNFISQSVGDVQVMDGGNTALDFMLESFIPVTEADFSFSPQMPQVGETVTFTGTVVSGTLPITYTWDFGDGQFGSGQVVSNTYMLSDTFDVTMTATNRIGTATNTHAIEVFDLCSPITGTDFSFAPQLPMVDETVTFTASVTSGSEPITYTWDFGDGSIDNGALITHTFLITNTMQSYTITLTANNACSLPQSVEKAVRVLPYQVFLPLITKATP